VAVAGGVARESDAATSGVRRRGERVAAPTAPPTRAVAGAAHASGMTCGGGGEQVRKNIDRP